MRQPLRPRDEAQFRAFCDNGRGMVYATLNKRLHRASCDWMDDANDRGKLLFDSEADAVAYVRRHYPNGQPCPDCCPDLLKGAQGRAASHRTSPPLTELQRAYRTLQVAEGAPLAVAHAAYKALMLTARVHPDVGGSTAQATALNLAIETIRRHHAKSA